MTTIDFITELFCRADDAMEGVPKHSQSKLYPSEILTLGLLFVLKGKSERAFYAWVERDLLPLFPNLPDRTRLFELFVQGNRALDRSDPAANPARQTCADLRDHRGVVALGLGGIEVNELHGAAAAEARYPALDIG